MNFTTTCYLKVLCPQTRSRLNQQAANFEAEIDKLEYRIDEEIDAGVELRNLRIEKKKADKQETGDAKKAEYNILKDLDRQVRTIYIDCVGNTFGPATMDVTTLELLKRIELKMEMLTQSLERLPEEKVRIAQRVSLYLYLFLLAVFL